MRRLECMAGIAATLGALCSAACAGPPDEPQGESIPVGVVLPFTGREAAIGRNLEQAILLAQEDVNRAGGVGDKSIRVISRDSNSGSERGFNDLLELLYVEKVGYLIGPEENDLATRILPDIKGLDVFNILPGYAAPSIERVVSRGAWLRLPPSAAAIGCGMARQQFEAGVRSANAIITTDDYNTSLAAEFGTRFSHLGGEVLPSVSVRADLSSYSLAIDQVFSFGAERTLLMAYPAVASAIVTEWEVGGRRGTWDLSPILRAEVFLLNTPFRALHGYSGLSPSLSLPSECEGTDPERPSQLSCRRDNAERFAEHFAERWDGDRPLPAAHFYYDAVVLLAMGLEYSLSQGEDMPAASALHRYIRHINQEQSELASWDALPEALERLSSGTPVRYVGAAAEYSFDDYGAARHAIFDTWQIDGRSFVDTGPLWASCLRNL
jgi:hypothetical protein